VSLVQLAIAAIAVSVALSAVMATAWCVQQTTGKSGWVDVSWSFGVGGAAFVAALWPIESDWPQWRQALVAALIAGWGLRLALHIAERNRGSGDDPRYRQLAIAWGHAAPRRMFLFLQSQAAVGMILVLSVALAAHNAHPGLRAQDVAGVAILLAAIAGEAVADRQLRAFVREPAHRGAVCDVGLWQFSRHPNYFFEWLSWLAYPVLAVDFGGDNDLGWLALAAPVCMYWTLVHVSGIPPLEEHMMHTRGDAFRSYQARVPAFFPFPLCRK